MVIEYGQALRHSFLLMIKFKFQIKVVLLPGRHSSSGVVNDKIKPNSSCLSASPATAPAASCASARPAYVLETK